MPFRNEYSAIVISCAYGVAPLLEREVAALGYEIVRSSETAVETEGSLRDAMRLNLQIRTGHRVFYMIGEFRVRDPDELYSRVVRMPWENYLSPVGYFKVDTSVDTPTIHNTQYAALKVKDAIADRMRDACGERPDSGNEDGGAAVFLHWVGADAAIYLNTTGPSLSKRGYRTQRTPAPMRESLAAALVMAGEWDGGGHFLNPMCGGGTLAIEAAWIAQNRAPALLRQDFAFMHLNGFPMADWRAMRQEAISAIKPEIEARIIASDVDGAAIRAATAHAAAAGVEELIEFDICDVAYSPAPEALPGSLCVLNPPYGERMGDSTTLRLAYADAGAFMRRIRAAGYRSLLFTGNPELAERSGITAEREAVFYNGPIECRLMDFGGYDPRKRLHAARLAEEGPRTEEQREEP